MENQTKNDNNHVRRTNMSKGCV